MSNLAGLDGLRAAQKNLATDDIKTVEPQSAETPKRSNDKKQDIHRTTVYIPIPLYDAAWAKLTPHRRKVNFSELVVELLEGCVEGRYDALERLLQGSNT